MLALLWFKAIRRVGRRTPCTAGWIALAICRACAFTDELHQSTLPARTGSARDFVIDALGATAMLTIARRRGMTEDREPRVAGAVAAEPAN